MKNKLFYLMTIGCQMNDYDSGQIRGVLFLDGYSETDFVENADIVIVNTCAIRLKAEHKAFSFLGRLVKLKNKKQSLIVAIGGCVAQQYGSDILKRMPHIDLVFGSNSIFRLSELISRIRSQGCKIVDLNILQKRIHQNSFFTSGIPKGKISAFVSVVSGCDNYCTYCVVPYVRGREVSRHPDSIIKEIRALILSGVKEVVLLGQNVNSYGVKDKFDNFANLLERVNRINGLERIRFVTSNPKDVSDELINAFCSLNKLCNHIHLPVQSGDNTILKRMNRKYTSEVYIEIINKLRKKCSDISISSDFIVGFPGESDLQFEASLRLIRLVRFDSLFAFSYSDRPNTVAFKFAGKLNSELKQERLQRLLKLQNHIATEKNSSIVGKVEEVLVEGLCRLEELKTNEERKLGVSYWFGRTSSNRTVRFKVEKKDNSKNLKGELVNVCLLKAKANSFSGKLLEKAKK